MLRSAKYGLQSDIATLLFCSRNAYPAYSSMEVLHRPASDPAASSVWEENPSVVRVGSRFVLDVPVPQEPIAQDMLNGLVSQGWSSAL